MRLARSDVGGVALVWLVLALLMTAPPPGNAQEPQAPDDQMVGGANSPPPSPPPKFVIDTAELSAGALAVKVPTGTYAAPPGGAPNYAVPGPIAAFKGPDGVWRGHGYLETYRRLLSFKGQLGQGSATLQYAFEGGKSYKVSLTAADGAILMDEESDLGPRNLFVFDCYYGQWLPSAGFAVNLAGTNHAFLYLPCFYDKAEVTISPGLAADDASAKPEDRPGGVAVTSRDPARKDVAGFWCRQLDTWKNANAMGIQLWQRRQLPGDPASRHFLGPETKSDSTPNPRTAGMLGRSLYEGHVTIELSLGVGVRKLGFAAAGKGETKQDIPEAFKKLVRANQ